MKLPPTVQLRQDNAHRLVPRQYALDEQGPLSRLADDDAELGALIELEGSTDNCVLGESGLLPGISIHELVFGVPYAHIVNAAFTMCAYGTPKTNSWMLIPGKTPDSPSTRLSVERSNSVRALSSSSSSASLDRGRCSSRAY